MTPSQRRVSERASQYSKRFVDWVHATEKDTSNIRNNLGFKDPNLSLALDYAVEWAMGDRA